MFHVFAALIGLYVIGRFVPSLPVTAGWKWAAAFIILLVSQYHLLNRFLFGGMASPEVPFSILVFGGWLFGAFLLLAGLLLLKDLASLLLLVFRHTGLLSSGFHLGYRTTLGLGVAALLLSAIGVWQAVRIPDVHRIDVTVNRLPAGLDGLRLVQLTDLHASRLFQAPWIRAVADKTNALDPDLIVITGDLVDGTTANRAPDVAPLSDLKARLGVFAVTGNHEYYSNYRNWMKAFESLGLRILKNEHVVLNDKGQSLVLAGVTDRVAAKFGLPAPKVLPPTPNPVSIFSFPAIPTADRSSASTGLPKWPTMVTYPDFTESAICSSMSATAQDSGAVFPSASANRLK